MSKVIISTITPVHIGSGNLLQNNTDFVVERDDEETYIHIIDDKKIFDLIGKENLNAWLLSIEKKQDTFEFVKRYSSNVSYDDISKHLITSFARGISQNATLKETIRNGAGKPYIPGSSIKGAIRTAVLSSLADGMEMDKLESKVFNNNYLSAKPIEGFLFGNDPKTDIFRFLRIGDAHFHENIAIATRMINLNITHRDDDLHDASKAQLVEAIGISEESTINMYLSLEYYQHVKRAYRQLGTLPPEMQSLPDLFMMINAHTEKLVKQEIDFWTDIDKTGAEVYIEEMQNILNEINRCKKGESCILRIGYGSGWRFITGAWTERLKDFDRDIVNRARPSNYRYEEYDFPKSRKIDEDNYVLGFVKLSIEN